MSKNVEDKLIQCPYYRQEARQVIHCEGIQPNTGLRLGFAGIHLMTSYKDQFCRSGWCSCRIAKMLNEMYDYQP